MANSSLDENVLFPGPSFHVDLPTIDACHPVHYSRRLLIFRCASSEQRATQLTALKIGLQGLVLHCPILGGIVTALPPDEALDGWPDWRTIVPGPGLELVVRDLCTAIASFEDLEQAGFPSSLLPPGQLVPIPEDISNDRPFAACKVQFSAITGGTILTFSMSHSVGDGSATNELLRVLSLETCVAQKDSSNGTANKTGLEAPTAVLGLDRNVVRNMASEVTFNIQDHPGYRYKSTTLATTPPPEQTPVDSFKATSPEVPVIIRISSSSVAQLKADATSQDGPPISTHDALTALIWRSVLLIRSRRSAQAKELPASTVGNVFLPSDARRHANIPQSYIGNVVYQLTAALDLGTLFSASGLQHAASAVRRSITAVSPALVASYNAKMRETWVDWAFMGTYATTGVAMGTDWTSSELYGHEWGKAFGPLVRYRYPGEAFICVLPRLPDGTAELLLSVMPQEVDMLTGPECFGKYLEA